MLTVDQAKVNVEQEAKEREPNASKETSRCFQLPPLYYHSIALNLHDFIS
jgi:hypothetical protein